MVEMRYVMYKWKYKEYLGGFEEIEVGMEK